VATYTFFPHYEEEQVTVWPYTTTAMKHYSFKGQPIATRKGGVLSYVHADHLGSRSVETNSSGTQNASRTYYAYGSTRTSSGTLQTDRTYTGQKSDGTGLLYYNARFYDPALGTFLSPDTLVPDAGRVVDYNRFLYVRGNPLRYSDPTGHCVFAPPFDTLVCVALLAFTMASSASPPPPSYPINGSSPQKCTDSLPDCFGDVVRLKDFGNSGSDNPIPIKEFNAFADKVAADLHNHDVDWPGLSGGRATYDTPFYNGGQSERRTGDPNAQIGMFPAAQQACIESVGCAGRSEINYIAQGMWGARTGESKPVSVAIVRAWKFVEYQDTPSEGTLFWLQYGYDYYQQWLEQQRTNTSTP